MGKNLTLKSDSSGLNSQVKPQTTVFFLVSALLSPSAKSMWHLTFCYSVVDIFGNIYICLTLANNKLNSVYN